jgi:hypothetical protein
LLYHFKAGPAGGRLRRPSSAGSNTGITGELASPATEPERRVVGEQPIAAVFMRM